MSFDDLVDLECLSSLEHIGETPDGCEPKRYLRLELVENRDRAWVLTSLGKQRLAELRAKVAQANASERKPLSASSVGAERWDLNALPTR